MNKNLDEAVVWLEQAAAAKKCWRCGCLHQTLGAIERAMQAGNRPADLDTAVSEARERLVAIQYDCLGCEVCFPALAIGALNRDGSELAVDVEPCPTEMVEEREGWPPLPGDYTALRYQAPVAVCTLTGADLTAALARERHPEVAIVGMMQTENLGIERVITNVLANPNIRFLILCGADSEKAIGHLPGQSLVALAQSGVDERGRIIGARGKRPVLRNISREAVEHFRRTVEVVDLLGSAHIPAILAAVAECAARTPGPAEPFAPERTILPVLGYIPERMVSDPAGYFVVYTDRAREMLVLEHYANTGVLDAVIEGKAAAELYTPAVERGLLSRLDHAAYLGRELARAEQALRSGDSFVQDGAPESAPQLPPEGCGCRSGCAPAAGG